jgi:prepilin-type N-terminal cleavage/methylation domain-containing protein
MRASRTGFTLMELLVVIALIAAVAALSLSAVNNIWISAKDAAIQNEINQMTKGCELFKQRYGVYPPSIILLREKGGYHDQKDLWSSARFLRQIFPGIDLELYTTSKGKEWHDWNGNGVADDTILASGSPNINYSYLFGINAYVLFLGGIPQYDTSLGRHIPTGFCKDRAYPTRKTPPGTHRDGPFFPFDIKRLKYAFHLQDRESHLQVDLNGRDFLPIGFATYYDHYGSPYAYRASLKGTIDPNPNPLVPYDGLSGGAENGHVYIARVGTRPGETIYHGDDSFQIVSAGHDRQFGDPGDVSRNREVPWPLPQDCDPQHRDNIASFSNGRLSRGK